MKDILWEVKVELNNDLSHVRALNNINNDA